MTSREHITRSFAVSDANVEGRTVEAYAAVFNRSVKIHDWLGEYDESIESSAFDKTLKEQSRFPVIYNHGMTIDGGSSDRATVPIGSSQEVRADANGLYTRSVYHNTPLADEVLEAIRSGSVQSQSFSGTVLKMERAKDDRGKTVSRTLKEIKLREYGPTPFPAYEDAAILSVRSALANYANLNDEDRARLVDEIKRYLTDEQIQELAAPLQTEPDRTATPNGAGSLNRAQIRARLYRIGVL